MSDPVAVFGVPIFDGNQRREDHALLVVADTIDGICHVSEIPAIAKRVQLTDGSIVCGSAAWHPISTCRA